MGGAEVSVISVGVDVGSLTAKAVVWDDTQQCVLGRALLRSSAVSDDVGSAVYAQALAAAGVAPSRVTTVVGTGYGRVSLDFAARCVTEITCHARGVHHVLPQVRMIIDIGGQDSKVIRCDEAGRALDFEMNDRCAAGTGRFLEVMAAALGTDLPGLAGLALAAPMAAPLSSTCTVFAESEVIGLLAHGTPAAAVAAGLCDTVAQRVLAMVGRLGATGPVAFTGGVALNEAVGRALERRLGTVLHRPPHPQFTGALGAALIGAEGRSTYVG